MLNEFGSLTKREKEVMELVKMGMTDKEIAKCLNISLKTVNSHVVNILSKHGIHDRKKLVFYKNQ